MLFNSYVFVFVFLPVVLLLWWRPLPTAARLAFLAAASYVFYAYWDWRFAGLMLATTVVDYLAGRAIGGASEPSKRKRWLVLSLVFNLGCLAFFKYFDFFAASVSAVARSIGAPELIPLLHVVLPIGISFYTFESITYTVDIYRGVARSANSFLHYAVFISIFPKLIAGPIIRYTDVEEQYRRLSPVIDWEMMHRGVCLFVFGMAKKLLLADVLAGWIDPMFAASGQMGFGSGWASLLGYSFQIYFDFSAYSDMALGLGFMLGFQFPRNFDRPYTATSISDFWSRWHITLSRWLRDYLFIPLGGSRGSVWLTARNLVITMFLGGLWHGANWTFVVWGLYHGLLLAAYHGGKALLGGRAPAVPAWTSRVFVFLLVTLGWALFRHPDLAGGMRHLQALAGIHGSGGLDVPVGLWLWLALSAAWTAAVPEIWDWKLSARPVWAVVTAIVALVCLLRMGAPSPFLYFQF